jgi:hypothetical protein
MLEKIKSLGDYLKEGEINLKKEQNNFKRLQIISSNSKNWSLEDYLNWHVNKGKATYCYMKLFMCIFPDFGIKSTIKIITDSDCLDKDIKPNIIKDFKNGLMKYDMSNNKAIFNAYEIIRYKPYFKKYNDYKFVSAIINLFKDENVIRSHDFVIAKFKENPNILEPQLTISNYMILIKEIYNNRFKD